MISGEQWDIFAGIDVKSKIMNMKRIQEQKEWGRGEFFKEALFNTQWRDKICMEIKKRYNFYRPYQSLGYKTLVEIL